MEWHHFEYFQMLARTEHMTQSAKLLSISQPALSRSISRLEEEVGVPLFDRQGRSISLNKYGHLFLKRVERIMKEFEEGKREIQALLDPEEGEISLGFLHTLGPSYIPRLISSFREVYPKTKFRLYQNNSHTLLRQLEEGEIDICLLSNMEIKHPIHWRILRKEELFLSVPTCHRFSHYESILLEEVREEKFVLLKKGYSLRSITDQLFERVGIIPNITFEGEEVPTIAGLISAGFGISLLPRLHKPEESNVIQIPVRSPKCERLIGLAWNEKTYMSAPTLNLKNFVLECKNEL
ncbi:LysR family transcriptional regulator [Priestia endophytica]|jgi:DNA-binding transcriptional LysR family regulator|uniref:LysR family transcriptional regulator n=1 Tax=Priestia endophytica TaxID=135735 RepID=UPI000F52F521|nr:LysR family transcriptional regulator [Priestia endophytica]MED4072122.1 LysR family transcriptional regulator [Priestia endophytica]RPK09592.1 hypothetical protein FH5_04455 [Priestia endophytica]